MTKNRHEAVSEYALEEGRPEIVSIKGRSIGIIRANGKIYAVRNMCPHKRAPVCRGVVNGTMLASEPGSFCFGMKNQILQCPWHGWEFDLETGQTITKVSDRRLTFYPVEIDEGKVYVLL